MSQPITLERVLALLAQLSSDRKIRVLDHQFARFISQFESQPLVVLASALVSYQSGQGDVCVELVKLANTPLFGLTDYEQAVYFDDFQLNKATVAQLQQQLSQSTVQGHNAPLLLDDNRLYLQRYWQYEQQISQFLQQRAQQHQAGDIKQAVAQLFAPDFEMMAAKLASNNNSANDAELTKFCDTFFNLRPEISHDLSQILPLLAQANSGDDIAAAYQLIAPSQRVDWQQLAVSVASRNSFSVISGGPGTGKTTTVTKLLALLVELSNNEDPQRNLNIELVAPTGKAAARLTESITGALATLNIDPAIKAQIPCQASTIHRLLGVIPKRSYFKHNSQNPLHLDVIIVDEASMVDISLMAKLLSAIPSHAKLILLGDKDQLASVEAGAVFADICHSLNQGPHYSNELNQWLSEITGFDMAQLAPSNKAGGIGDSLCLLQKSYRFDQHSGIGQLAQAVNQSDLHRLKQVWQGNYQDISLHPYHDNMLTELSQMVINGYQDYLIAAKAVTSLDQVGEILELFNKFQLLTPLRGGKVGIDNLNQQIEQRLNKYQFINLKQGLWYVGRPVMVQENDHQQQLFNGDIGIVLPTLTSEGTIGQELRVYFKMADGTIKSFLPSRLPKVDTVYAMTIHKSQGSEFNHVVMVLPNHWTPLLTKELIYTGITRAKHRYDLFSPIKVLQQATKSLTERSSGLAAILAKGIR